ncbi:MAG TPA: protein-disulfide reductase DsbD family protein, partial [Agriterribacter sp.]|nr:protein-disulfide reductase DsbD family protein [Agriterribacter sp.]
MKQKATLFLFFLLPLFCAAQESPLRWEVNSIKNNSSSYTVTIKAALDPQWHIYADSIADIELEGLHITWDNENIRKNGRLTANPEAAILKDPVFDNRELRVYTGDFTLSQKVDVEGTAPAALKIQL